MDSLLSRTEKKRRAEGLARLVGELSALAPAEIGQLPCDEEVRRELVVAGQLRGGARQRQLKYVTKLLRQKPAEELYDFMVRKKGSRLKERRQFQELEHLRQTLITETLQISEKMMSDNDSAAGRFPGDFLAESKVLRTIVRQLPGVDQEQVKQAAMQFARTRNRKFSREIFRLLKAAADKNKFSTPQEGKNGI